MRKTINRTITITVSPLEFEITRVDWTLSTVMAFKGFSSNPESSIQCLNDGFTDLIRQLNGKVRQFIKT